MTSTPAVAMPHPFDMTATSAPGTGVVRINLAAEAKITANTWKGAFEIGKNFTFPCNPGLQTGTTCLVVEEIRPLRMRPLYVG